jgi:hypothetical protein
VRVWLPTALGLLLGAGPLHGQLPRIGSEVDTTVVTVGDRLTLEVAVVHAAEARVLWPDSLSLAPFEVLEATALPPVSMEGGVRSGVIFTLTAFELGELEIPSFEVEVLTPERESTILATHRFGIRVTSVGLDEGGDIRDVKGPMGIPLSPAGILLLALGAVLAAGVAYAVYRRINRRGSGPLDAGPTIPRRPAHEIALEALARLEASPLLERGEIKEFHIQGSEILRVYLEGRFNLPALEMTTADVTAGLEPAGLDPSLLDGFGSFLHQCDMVKFAKNRPPVEASLAVLSLGRHLVEETIPAPVPPVEDETPPHATPFDELREGVS